MGLKLIPLVATGVLGLGNLLHIIGLATPEWTTREGYFPYIGRAEITSGLWEACANDNCDRLENKESWLEACEAMAILGMLAGIGALALIAFYFVMNLISKDAPKSMGVLSLVAAIIAFIFILICIIIYAAKAKDANSEIDFGYSFGLDIAGAILILIGGGIAFAGTRG